MNEAALKKHEIFNKLAELSGQELGAVADFIDFMKYKKKQPQKKNFIKLQGILKDYNVNFMNLTTCRQETWKHLEEEFQDE